MKNRKPIAATVYSAQLIFTKYYLSVDSQLKLQYMVNFLYSSVENSASFLQPDDFGQQPERSVRGSHIPKAA